MKLVCIVADLLAQSVGVGSQLVCSLSGSPHVFLQLLRVLGQAGVQLYREGDEPLLRVTCILSLETAGDRCEV